MVIIDPVSSVDRYEPRQRIATGTVRQVLGQLAHIAAERQVATVIERAPEQDAIKKRRVHADQRARRRSTTPRGGLPGDRRRRCRGQHLHRFVARAQVELTARSDRLSGGGSSRSSCRRRTGLSTRSGWCSWRSRPTSAGTTSSPAGRVESGRPNGVLCELLADGAVRDNQREVKRLAASRGVSERTAQRVAKKTSSWTCIASGSPSSTSWRSCGPARACSTTARPVTATDTVAPPLIHDNWRDWRDWHGLRGCVATCNTPSAPVAPTACCARHTRRARGRCRGACVRCGPAAPHAIRLGRRVLRTAAASSTSPSRTPSPSTPNSRPSDHRPQGDDSGDGLDWGDDDEAEQ